jgi:hypothetical protein
MPRSLVAMPAWVAKANAENARRECCFACGRVLGKKPAMVDTLEDQTVFVGSECFKYIKAAGNAGWRPPLGGPRLYLLTDKRRDYLTSKGLL